MRTLSTDACIIGAGAGGAVLAAELAQGGMDVVLLEQGPQHDPATFSARPAQMVGRLYRDGGQTFTLGSPPIALPLGRGVGGTTTINSGTCFRTPEAVLSLWRSRYGLDLDEDSMRPYFERVEGVLSVTEVTPELAGGNAAVARRGAERLGWSHGYLRRNAKGCVGSGVCAFGCPTSAKQHTGITYVPRARAAGAEVITGANVTRVLTRSRQAAGVEAMLSGEGPIRIHAPLVAVAAGTIHTPGLLARSGLGGGSGQLGRNLALHPCSAVVALMDHVVDMARGVPQSFYIDEFARQGIMLEGIAGPPSYVAMSLPLSGRRHAEVMAQYRNLAEFGLMVSDTSRGQVGSLLGRPVIRYSLNRDDMNRFRVGLARTRELYEAAGAREVFLPLPPGMAPERARARDLKLMAFHPLGTARAHARADGGVVSGELEVHGARGVYVADGAVVPSALGVNPQLTIMALATRLADTLLSRAGSGLAPATTSGTLAGQ